MPLSTELDVPPRIGGDPPEPWPGMGVEVVRSAGCGGRRVDRFVADPVQAGGVWFMLPTGESELGCSDTELAARFYALSEVEAVYEGRTCIWRRT